MSMILPRDKNQYVISASGDVSGMPESATVHKATYKDPTTNEEVPVRIKIFNMYKIEDIYSFTTQLHEAETLDHQNLIKVHCTFKNQDQLWVIMSPPGFSIKSIIRSSSPHGLPENVVAFILKETLEALHYMHGKKKLHQNINAECVFLDEKFRVKLAYNSLISSDVVPNETLIGPGIMAYYRTENDKATDIWMLGLLALELFYGQIPVSDFEDFQLIVSEIDNGIWENHNQGSRIFEKLGFLSCFHEPKKKIPKLLGEVMAACLSRDPERRPTTNQLMEYELFQGRFTGHRSLEKLMRKACKYN